MFNDILKGYRVLDLSQYLPGPYATRLLADLGADVVKVEPPGGDPMRHFIYLDDDDISPLYKQVNAGKTVVSLNLKDECDRESFRQLLTFADVLLESYRPGVMARLGFSRDVIHDLNPVLIHCALSGFGQDGPNAQRAGHDITYMALSGMLSHTGTPQIPVVPFPPVSDYAGGQQAATMILASLLRRERMGQGAFIDTSLYEAVLSWQSFGLAGIGRPGRQLVPGEGLITGGVACYQIYETADSKFVVLGALEEKFWTEFCVAVCRPDWVSRQTDPMPQTELIAELRQLFSSETWAYWVEQLASKDCCFEPLLTPEEVVDQQHVAMRQLIEPATSQISPADIRFPAKLDSQYPHKRSPLVLRNASDIVDRWQQNTS